MAFCNSCGAALDAGTRFCNKCGATVTASSPAPAPARPAVSATPTPAPAGQAPKQGSSALKIIPIIVGVIVVIGVLLVGTLGFIGWRVARRMHVRQDGNNVKVETPFGSAETIKDPNIAARELTVEIYPGAQLQPQGSSSATFMNIHTVTARYQSSDSLDQVSSFYKAKFPNAMMSTCEPSHCSIMSTDQQNTTTVKMDANNSGTEITITQMNRKSN
jgi:hypothetical protein